MDRGQGKGAEHEEHEDKDREKRGEGKRKWSLPLLWIAILLHQGCSLMISFNVTDLLKAFSLQRPLQI